MIRMTKDASTSVWPVMLGIGYDDEQSVILSPLLHLEVELELELSQ